MANPNTNSTGLGMRGIFPIQTLTISSTYQINSGTAIAAGASVTDSVTFTGVLTTDLQVAVGYSDAVAALLEAVSIVLTDVVVTATNTVSLTWTNMSNISQTPPATSQAYYLVRLVPFRGR